MSKRGPRNKHQHPPVGEAWTWQTAAFLKSAAYRGLSISARKVLARLQVEHMSHAGTANGRLKTTYDQFEEYGVSRPSIRSAIDELEAMGILRIVGERHRRVVTTYNLTSLPVALGDYPPSNEWRFITAERVKSYHEEQREVRKVDILRKQKSKSSS